MKKIKIFRYSCPNWLLFGLVLFLSVYLSFKVFNGNYIWVVILLIIFIYFLLIGLSLKPAKLKMLLFNISAVFFALFLYEGFLWISDITTNSTYIQERTYTTVEFRTNHPYLGYIPNDGIFTEKKIYSNEVIYDVSYTIKNGLRYSPNSNEKSHNCVLFFGCSLTYGTGVPDNSTLPFYFNKFSERKYKIFNYGFEGYGPHQMLANIENRVARDIQDCENEKIAIYSFLPIHVGRAAGYSIWDQDGPKYEIIGGHLKMVGTFRNLPIRIASRLERSYLYRKLFWERKSGHDDVLRTIAIIKKSNELLLKKKIILYIFVWDAPSDLENIFQDQNDYYLLINELKKNNIKCFFLHEAISDYVEKEEIYYLHHDGHPNELANEKIAQYIYLQLKNYDQH